MIRMALIGLGKMGISHLAIARSHPDIDLVAVCDTTGYVLDVLNKYTGVKVYSDYKKLLAEEPLDAVLVATPSRFHGEMVRAALEKDLHVFCEKPFCLDVGEGRELAAIAKEKGRVTQVGYHFRFVGAFKEAKRLIAAGAVGKVHHVRAEAYGPVVLRPTNTTWRAQKNQGGGCLYDYACHAIDLVTYLVGTPDRVSGTILNRIFSGDVEDEVYANFHFPGGATGQLASNWSDESYRKMSTKITVWGTNGRISSDRQEVQIFVRDADKLTPELKAGGLKEGWNIHYTTELSDNLYYYLRGEEYSAQIDHFAQSVKNGQTATVSSFGTALETDTVVSKMLVDAARVAAANDAGEESIPTARQAPPRQRRFFGMARSLLG